MRSHIGSWCLALLVVLLLVECSNPPPNLTSDRPSSNAVSPTSQSTETLPASAASAPKNEARPDLGAAKPKTVPVREPEAPQTVPLTPEPQAAPPVAETVPLSLVNKVKLVILPAGTLIAVRTTDSVDSRTDRVGQTYLASIDSDLVIEDELVVQQGADASLKLVRKSRGEFVDEKSELQLQLERIFVDGNSYVAIGAGVMTGSGAAVAAITQGEKVLVPPESRLEFRLQQPVKIAVVIRPAT